MKIAILGTRGIPAAYSGFETAAEELASRLSQRGHDVVVYCRPHVVDRNLAAYRGARLVHLPTIQNKYLDTFVHTSLSAWHAARITRPDVALFFIAGNSPLCRITRAAGIPTLINIDGLDSDRHERRYGRRIGVVPYGVADPGHAGRQALDELGLEPRRYILFVGRLEPENNPHLLVEAFSRIDGLRARGMKLVIVGGAPYADDYIRQVRRTADPRVLFPGYVFGRRYWELQRHAYLFCAPTGVGGTHPVILEAMAAGNCVLVNDHPPNAETVGDAGVYFSGREGVSSLSQQLRRLLDDEPLVTEYRERARRRAVEFSWDVVADQYERLLSDVYEAARPGGTARSPCSSPAPLWRAELRGQRRLPPGELCRRCGDARPARSWCPG